MIKKNQKPIIGKSALLGRYYISSSYEDLGDGIVIMNDKTDITDDPKYQHMIKKMEETKI